MDGIWTWYGIISQLQYSFKELSIVYVKILQPKNLYLEFAFCSDKKYMQKKHRRQGPLAAKMFCHAFVYEAGANNRIFQGLLYLLNSQYFY